MKFKIEYEKSIPGATDYIGMNARAAALLKIPFKHKHPVHTIVVKKNQYPYNRKSTIVHEKVEEYLIKYKHMPYKPANSKRSAHHWALQYEKIHKPFNIREVNKLLKKKK